MAPRWRALLFLLLLATLASACGGGSTPASSAQKQPTLRIGLLLDDLHERWERDRDLIREVAKDMGAELLVEIANGDENLQAQQADKMLADGAKALIVVAHDTEKAAEIVTRAKAKNVPVVAYDRLIQNADVDLYIGFDVVRIGEMQAQYLLNRAPKGNYLLISGSETDVNARQLRKGQMEVLGPAVKKGAIKMVGEGWAEDWRADAAAKLTEQGLARARNSLAAIVASNDVTAGGAIGVLEQHGLAGKVLVSGQDAELDAIKRIVAGTQAMTVYKSLRTLTRLAARSAVLLAKGEHVDSSSTVNNGKKDVPTMLFDPIAVDKDNVDGVVIADGFLTREQVYGTK